MADHLIVVTCASGKQAAHLIPRLAEDKLNLRLVVNSDASLKRIKERYPSADVVQADLLDPDSCRRVVADATTIYHIGPSLHPFEAQIGFNMIDAARHQPSHPSSPPHFILSSVLWSQLSKLLHHDAKRGVEEYLIESPLPWTILSPTQFFDNLPVAALAAQDRPVFPALWDPETPMSLVALSDLADVAARVVRERDAHFFAQYAVVSTPPLSYTTVLEELGGLLGKPVEVERVPFERAVDIFLQRAYGGDVHPATRSAAERMLLHYRRHGLVGNPNVTRWLLRREPMGVRQWMQAQLDAARGRV